jgi:hypothetical protein
MGYELERTGFLRQVGLMTDFPLFATRNSLLVTFVEALP